MKTIFFLVVIILIVISSCTINKKTPSTISNVQCNCLSTINTDFNNIYKVTNNKSVIVCSNKTILNGQVLASAVYIKNCTSDDTLSVSSEFYTFNTIKDTLELIPYYFLPQGIDYTYKQTIVFIEKIYFTSEGKLQKTIVLNPNFIRYTQSQILDIFEEYQLTTATTDEKVILLMDKLLMASLSGNQLAMKTFRNFEAKYKNMNEVQQAKFKQNKDILKQYLVF